MLPPCMLLLGVLLACSPVAEGDGDGDSDGYTADIDCDDGNPAVSPRADEVCNTLDDNCDGRRDEGCDVDPTGSWTVLEPVAFACDQGVLDVSTVYTGAEDVVSEYAIEFSFRLLDFSDDWRGLSGWLVGDDFTAGIQVARSNNCVYDYEVVGSFVTPYELRATLAFIPYPGLETWCGDCVEQSWAIVGERVE